MKATQMIGTALVLAATMFFPSQLFAQKIKVGYWTSGFSLGFGAVMEQMKFAENQGLNVEWIKFAEVNGPTRAIVSNAIDVAFAAPSTNSMGIAADGVPVKIVLATQIAEAQIVVLDGSPIKAVGDLKGKKIGMSPPGSATHAIATAILDHNFGLKPSEYSIAPGNEAQLAQFLSQKEIDAGVLRSVTLAQMEEVKLRKLASVVDEWKKLTKGNAPPILAVTIVYSDYLDKNPEPVAKFIAATRNALQYGSKNKSRVAEILEKAANMNATDARAYADQWDGAYIASFEPADLASLKRMYDIVKAAGAATQDVPDNAFNTGPYIRAKKIK
ncbi:MAG TPA: ABC transporter substrate-binding protein [Methylomirabilota bacterium]|nr:ABC transporter substrate-binding protein [Methylomirabilota bacterium]